MKGEAIAIAYTFLGYAVGYGAFQTCCYAGPLRDMPPCKTIIGGDVGIKMVTRQAKQKPGGKDEI